MIRWLALWLLFAGLAGPAGAEPWIAVKEGMKCASCHLNASGGGMRNAYGNLYAQMQLAARQLAAADAERWTGSLAGPFSVGGNLRAEFRETDVPNNDTERLFALDEARLYLRFSPLPEQLDVYIDQHFAPGGSINREAYARLWLPGKSWYLKAGQMYLPYGWRLEDDSAFIRTVPGINFTTPDTGVELGWESARWSAQFALSNGNGGGPEIDTGKQASLRVERIANAWRAGFSANLNDTDHGDRSMQNVFAGLRTGPVAWLAEIDFIEDDALTGGSISRQVSLLEANWFYARGHNLKLTAENFDADSDRAGPERRRYSLFWEYFPFEFTQLRAGVRQYDGDPLVDTENREELVLQLHGFF